MGRPSDSDADSCASEGEWVRAVIHGERAHALVEEMTRCVENPMANDGTPAARAARARARRARARRAMETMTTEMATSRSFAEAAVEMGALEAARRAVDGADDEETRTRARALAETCARAASSIERAREETFGEVTVIVLETALANGVGARLWRAARTMCARLAADASAIRGKRVLELGAGVGACGILCAKLGARAVVLSDFEEPLLDALERSIALNDVGDRCVVAAVDWRRELRLERTPGARALDDADVFDVIIGTDVLYEKSHVDALPACIARRLAPNGACFLVNAERYAGAFDDFHTACTARGLRVHHPELDVDSSKAKDWHVGGARACVVTRL